MALSDGCSEEKHPSRMVLARPLSHHWWYTAHALNPSPDKRWCSRKMRRAQARSSVMSSSSNLSQETPHAQPRPGGEHLKRYTSYCRSITIFTTSQIRNTELRNMNFHSPSLASLTTFAEEATDTVKGLITLKRASILNNPSLSSDGSVVKMIGQSLFKIKRYCQRSGYVIHHFRYWFLGTTYFKGSFCFFQQHYTCYPFWRGLRKWVWCTRQIRVLHLRKMPRLIVILTNVVLAVIFENNGVGHRGFHLYEQTVKSIICVLWNTDKQLILSTKQLIGQIWWSLMLLSLENKNDHSSEDDLAQWIRTKQFKAVLESTKNYLLF